MPNMSFSMSKTHLKFSSHQKEDDMRGRIAKNVDKSRNKDSNCQ